ncbi:hypothetical protein B0A49_01924 [Cryomyces minteri]|uniref:Uncharacterized protein n=1 Tax=Cryomyces minteri TaxID=331657 RepID=A0A4U0XG75_9PEZI|nr:hypothetical protein B0A49_01924 [Cryomyces minteri]
MSTPTFAPASSDPPPPTSALFSRPRSTSRSQSRSTFVTCAESLDFDREEFEDDILAPRSAVTARPAKATAYTGHTTPPVEDPSDLSVLFVESRKRLPLLVTSAAPTSANTSASRASLHARAKSITSFVPALGGLQSGPSHSESKSRSKNQLFNDLFSGASAPINVGFLPSPTKEERAMDFPASRRKSSTPSAISKFSWFGARSSTSASPRTIPEEQQQDDPLLRLDVRAELFPHGSVDASAPSSFTDLLTNAEALVARLQKGYREKFNALRDVAAEKSVQEDEVQEAETRARHLKMQLDDMAVKAVEQDRTMQALADELASERLSRREEEDARQEALLPSRASDASDGACEETLLQRGKRDSGSSSSSSSSSDASTSDSGFESDADSSSASSAISGPSSRTTLSSHTHPLSSAPARPPPHLPPATGSPAAHAEDPSKRAAAGHDDAWLVVDVLRRRNRLLEARVAELEETVDGCLGLVAGLRP